MNVLNGGHYVLAHDYNGDNIIVNDPGSSDTYYRIGQCVDGQTGVYSMNSAGYHDLVGKITKFLFLRSEDDVLKTMANRPIINVAYSEK